MKVGQSPLALVLYPERAKKPVVFSLIPQQERAVTWTASIADALSGDLPPSKQIVARSIGYLNKQELESDSCHTYFGLPRGYSMSL